MRLLIFIMGIPILVRPHLYIEAVPLLFGFYWVKNASCVNMRVDYCWCRLTPWWLYIPWWRHQMETFSAWLAICAGNSPVPVTSPHKGQWHGALMFPLIFAWINGWVNNREAGELRRHLGHYDVIVMQMPISYTHGDTLGQPCACKCLSTYLAESTARCCRKK